MAKKKSVRKQPKKAAKKQAKAKRRPARASAPSRKKAARKAAPRKAAARKAPPRKAAAPKVRTGVITHTELASADPEATRAWCEKVLAWKFGDAMPTPTGPYHMWRFDNATGGGIRGNNPPEPPGSIPYCEVEDIQATYAAALAAGATEMFAPEALPGGMGWIAIVAAPGGCAIGFWGMK